MALPAQVFIASATAVFRDAIRLTVARMPDVHVVGEAANWAELEATLPRNGPVVLLLSAILPGFADFERAGNLLRAAPEAQLVFFIRGDVPPARLVELFRLRPRAVINNEVRMEDLKRVLVLVQHGLTVFPEDYLRQVALAPGAAEASVPGAAELSDRERELLGLLAKGYSEKEAAARLNIGPRTVHTYLERAKAKLGAVNRTHLVALAVESRMVSPLDR